MSLNLNIPEEFTLLALDKGDLANAVTGYGELYFAAAIFMELFVSEKLAVEEQNIKVISTTFNETSYLNKVTRAIRESGKTNSLKNWIYEMYVYNKFELQKSIFDSLTQHNILEKQNGKFMLVFPYTKYFQTDIGNGESIIEKLRAELLEDGAVSPRTYALTLLLERAGILPKYFSKYESERLKKRLKEIHHVSSGMLIETDNAVQQIIDEVNSSAFVATVV